MSLNTDEDCNLPVARTVVKERNVSENSCKPVSQLRSSGKSATTEMSRTMSHDFEPHPYRASTARQTTEPGWQGRKALPPAASQLESENNSSGWLRRVRPAVRVQGGEAEVRILIHKASVLSACGEASRQGIVSASSVEECAFSLTASPGNGSGIAHRIEDQTAAPSKGVCTDPPNG